MMKGLRTALLVIGIALICIGLFFAGTVLGFNMALKRLSGCQEVPCSDIQQAINATHPAICESCGINKYHWLIVR